MNLVLKATTSDDFEDENIALITKKFTRMLKRGQAFQKKRLKNHLKTLKTRFVISVGAQITSSNSVHFGL